MDYTLSSVAILAGFSTETPPLGWFSAGHLGRSEAMPSTIG